MPRVSTRDASERASIIGIDLISGMEREKKSGGMYAAKIRKSRFVKPRRERPSRVSAYFCRFRFCALRKGGVSIVARLRALTFESNLSFVRTEIRERDWRVCYGIVCLTVLVEDWTFELMKFVPG